MKTTMSFMMFLTLLKMCDFSEPNKGYEITFSLTDTLGHQASVFRAAEEFDLTFQIRNLTGTDQPYSHTGPRIVFEILSGDTMVASSVDGLTWVQVVMGGIIENGKSEIHTWRGPNSVARNPPIALGPGSYLARAAMRYGFHNEKPVPPSPIELTVVP